MVLYWFLFSQSATQYTHAELVLHLKSYSLEKYSFEHEMIKIILIVHTLSTILNLQLFKTFWSPINLEWYISIQLKLCDYGRFPFSFFIPIDWFSHATASFKKQTSPSTLLANIFNWISDWKRMITVRLLLVVPRSDLLDMILTILEQERFL